MATTNTYTQVYVQFVFAVKFRSNLIKPEWEDELHKFITSVVKTNNHLLVAINSCFDHIHILIAMKPHQSMADLMSVVKSKSSLFVNEKKFIKSKFRWQEGYGGFSYSKSHVDRVIKYIDNQKEHHKKISFKDEYLALLKKYEVEYNEEYVFHELLDG
ncbi:MAG: IS200/IS605 family transposase [Saprospiraceae bacterium]|nr:IS200/IS605 family transposase [Saprospiraceae bacterium]